MGEPECPCAETGPLLQTVQAVQRVASAVSWRGIQRAQAVSKYLNVQAPEGGDA